MSQKIAPPPAADPPRPLRAFFRTGRGRSGGSLICATLVHLANVGKRPVLAADGDPNNPTLSRIYPSDGPNGVDRPVGMEAETGRVWLAATLSKALEKRSSVVIDMGGGDRISEELSAEAGIADFLRENGMAATFGFFTGPERDDFDHVHRIWQSSAFKDGEAILFLNEGLNRAPTRSSDPFAWLREDPRFADMEKAGVRVVTVPALSCIKYVEETGLTVFDVIAGKKTSNGTMLNPLWQHMTKRWFAALRQELQADGLGEWLP